MVVFRIRSEAIKMYPLVKELKSRENLNTVVCVTGQHREMLDTSSSKFFIFSKIFIVKSNNVSFLLYQIGERTLNYFNKNLDLDHHQRSRKIKVGQIN